jgi:hypothetical protein
MLLDKQVNGVEIEARLVCETVANNEGKVDERNEAFIYKP